jgi:hypothetical protein
LGTSTGEIQPAALSVSAAGAQVTGRKNFAAARVGLQIAVENFRHKAEAYLGRQRITNRQRKMKKTTKTVTPPAPATKASAKKTAAPAVKKTVAKKPPTLITIRANIGFGNTLYLRGDGPGLNWDKGVPLDCLSDDKWSLTIEHATPFVFKVLLNDLVWCSGDDYIAAPGASMDITPEF